jgi:hypothetical protein
VNAPAVSATAAVSGISATISAAGITSAAVVAVPVARTILKDRQWFGAGQLQAFSSPWCADIDPKLRVGVDLVDTVSFATLSFPKGITIVSAAPFETPNLHHCGVYGYHFVAYGNYDHGEPLVSVTSRQVSSISKFTETFAWHPVSAGGRFNVLNEFYTTATPGGASAKVHEIGLFPHISSIGRAYAEAGDKIGVWTDASGRAWTITRQGRFLMVVSASEVKSATIDFRSLLIYLMSRGAISGSEWVNGAAFGVENVSGRSTNTIDSWSISLS